MRIDLQEPLCDPYYLAELFGVVPKACGTPIPRILGIATDSKEVRQGDLFLALQGEKADGSAYIPSALAAGAVAILTSVPCDAFCESVWLFSCECAEKALLSAAKAWRERCAATVIAVTGSAGKTTTKEAIACVLGDAPHNEGNYNSTIGMPLSVLSFPKSKFWVCELGINHVGEMEKMSAALCPDIGVITNIGSAHVGNFGDLQTLQAEKLRLLVGMRETGSLVMPLALKNIDLSASPCRIFYVGEGKEADLALENIVMDTRGMRCDLRYANGEITNLVWPIPGSVGCGVLGLASAVGVLCGKGAEEIARGLEKAAHLPMHTRVCTKGEMLFLEDHYNSSPEACLGALEALRYLSGNSERVAVLGDMLELGKHSDALHNMLGRAVCAQGIDYLFTYGKQAEQIARGAREVGMSASRIFSFSVGEERLLAQTLLSCVAANAAVLFKASRAMRMERVVEEVRSRFE